MIFIKKDYIFSIEKSFLRLGNGVIYEKLQNIMFLTNYAISQLKHKWPQLHVLVVTNLSWLHINQIF